MTAALVLLEAAHRELPMPAWVFGVVAFALLAIALLVLHGYSTRRPHS
ncbi:hypothetical protein [Auraticoccus cholistanensis]|nr:hypothetical protein [Auraticoccus cholistanensis]